MVQVKGVMENGVMTTPENLIGAESVRRTVGHNTGSGHNSRNTERFLSRGNVYLFHVEGLLVPQRV